MLYSQIDRSAGGEIGVDLKVFKASRKSQGAKALSIHDKIAAVEDWIYAHEPVGTVPPLGVGFQGFSASAQVRGGGVADSAGYALFGQLVQGVADRAARDVPLVFLVEHVLEHGGGEAAARVVAQRVLHHAAQPARGQLVRGAVIRGGGGGTHAVRAGAGGAGGGPLDLIDGQQSRVGDQSAEAVQIGHGGLKVARVLRDRGSVVAVRDGAVAQCRLDAAEPLGKVLEVFTRGGRPVLQLADRAVVLDSDQRVHLPLPLIRDAVRPGGYQRPRRNGTLRAIGSFDDAPGDPVLTPNLGHAPAPGPVVPVGNLVTDRDRARRTERRFALVVGQLGRIRVVRRGVVGGLVGRFGCGGRIGRGSGGGGRFGGQRIRALGGDIAVLGVGVRGRRLGCRGRARCGRFCGRWRHGVSGRHGPAVRAVGIISVAGDRVVVGPSGQDLAGAGHRNSGSGGQFGGSRHGLGIQGLPQGVLVVGAVGFR
ncbi:DUF7019 family protein [Nocardia wallacei]|uniref:DUF7019 family protein n=1 Tax=Nocardia wallacei TaxID=480035 RepID=UPI003CC8019E